MSSPDLVLSNTTENFRAGNIAYQVREWEKLTKDPWVIGMVKGVSIPLFTQVTQMPPPPILLGWVKGKNGSSVQRLRSC